MKETGRYILAQPYLSQHMVFNARFQKYGMISGKGTKSTCLVNIELEDGTEIADHIWCDSEELLKANLRTGQYIQIRGTLGTRKRATADSTELQLDLRLSKVKFISKGKHR